MIKTPENDIQSRLTKLGLITLIATPFIGPAALVAGGAIFAGKAARYMFNDEARRNYLQEKEEMKQYKNRIKNYGQMGLIEPIKSIKSINPLEPTRTTLARPIPKRTLQLIKKENQRIQYTQALEDSAKIIDSYLNYISGEEASRITEIEIRQTVKKSFFGIPIGKQRLEVIVKK